MADERAFRVILRPLRTLRWIIHQLVWGARNSADLYSFRRYSADVLLYHALAIITLPGSNGERTIRIRGDIQLTYRLNRGDIQGIREVWVDQVYRPLDIVHPKVVVDLGANIGLTSVYFAKRYGSSTVVAVEPSAANCRIAKLNFERNKVPGILIEAAVGPTAGYALFESSCDSNLGHLGASGEPVTVVTMPQILARTPQGTTDVLKMDIEGGEADLLNGDVAWLDSVNSLLVEFHPPIVDYPALVSIVRSSGFIYVPAGTLRKTAADCFIREYSL